MLKLEVTRVTDSERSSVVKAANLDELIIAAELVVDPTSALVIEPSWALDKEEEKRIVNAIDIVDSPGEQSDALIDWIESMSDSVEYGYVDLETQLNALGVNVYIASGGGYRGFGQWEAFAIGEAIRLLSYRDDSRWKRVWARFGYTNVESRVGGYWRHSVGLVDKGVAAIARDEDEVWRSIQLFAIDETKPNEISALIRSVEDGFSDGDPFPSELVQSHIDGNPLDSVLLEGGHSYDLTLDIENRVLALL